MSIHLGKLKMSVDLLWNGTGKLELSACSHKVKEFACKLKKKRKAENSEIVNP